MITDTLRRQILDLIKREVVPATGCTEPVAVALCAARATELLGSLPERITVGLSPNMLKNAMGVGIPGTGMTGLPIAIALGCLRPRSDEGLGILNGVDADLVARGREYMDTGAIEIRLCEDAPSKLYIDVEARGADGTRSRAVICDTHTRFIRLECGDDVLLSLPPAGDVAAADDVALNLAMVHEFAMETPVEELRFILQARELNSAAATRAYERPYGHSLGRILRHQGEVYFGDTPLAHMMAATSAACDARMGGCPVAVMSNSGSGNQGITATMPVVSFAADMSADEERTVRALTLSHLTSIYIKQGLGRLSALCGCVVASTGASAGIAYLMGADFEGISAAVKNMVANLTGMICDGAKPSCAMKIASATATALMSALLAVNGQCASDTEGIVCSDVDRTIANLTLIGKDAMRATDTLVLRIMTDK